MYGKLKADVREIIKRLCDYRNIEIIEGAVCADHVHLCLSIPPSEKVSDVIAYIKGKSALTLIVKVVVSKNLYFLFVQVIRYCSVPDVSINK